MCEHKNFAVAVLTLSVALLICAAAPVEAAVRHSSRHLPPTVASGTCKGLNKLEFAVSEQFEVTNSVVPSYVNLNDGGSISFSTLRTGCIVTSLSAESGADDDGNALVVRVLLDESTVCYPDSNFFAGYQTGGLDGGMFNHSMTYICSNVAPGNHNIQVQYAAAVSGDVGFAGRTLTVTHR